jgi:hypothetical protein
VGRAQIDIPRAGYPLLEKSPKKPDESGGPLPVSGTDKIEGVLEAQESLDTQVEAHIEQHRLAYLIKPIVNIRNLIKQLLLEVQDISLQHGIGFFL